MSVRIRPNEAALVISRVTPFVVTTQRYSLCVCAETMILMRGSSRDAMSRIGLPARLPAQPLSTGEPVCAPPSWITSTHALMFFALFESSTALAASASSWNVRPATPVGVTIVGVDLSTSPMKPTSTLPTPPPSSLLTPNAGNRVWPVASTFTFADRYWKFAPG